MTDAAIRDDAKLDIARVLEGTFKVLARNIVTFGVLALILTGLPAAVIAILQVSALRGADGAITMETFSSAAFWMNTSMAGLASLILNAILQGALIYATIQDLNGEKPSIGAALATGLRSFLPLIGVTILFVLGVAFGMILLLVPAIMIACAWCVAVPSLVADRTGVFGAFSRSADLTRGNRWRIFALFIVVWVIAIVIGAVITAVAVALTFTNGGMDPVALARSPVQIVANLLSNTVTSMISSTGVAVLYVELRRAREGLGPQWLSEIFS